MVKIYDKLVRDNVPDIIKKQHEKPVYRRMGAEEFRRELFRKLKEECNEVENATSREELIEELGDVLEVLKAIASLEDAHFSEVIESAQEKKLIKGGFEKRIYLEKTISRK